MFEVVGALDVLFSNPKLEKPRNTKHNLAQNIIFTKSATHLDKCWQRVLCRAFA